jgi:hypothetical protein
MGDQAKEHSSTTKKIEHRRLTCRCGFPIWFSGADKSPNVTLLVLLVVYGIRLIIVASRLSCGNQTAPLPPIAFS